MSRSSQHTIVLTGQPNCGKSTLFNEAAGYRSVAANFPGATVEYTKSQVRVSHEVCDLIDLPGFYSLTSLDEAAAESQRFLLHQSVDVIVNVVDASLLGRSLELTLQLLDLEIPMVLCLNMMDEAERKGILIDIEKLSTILGVPVVSAVASRGKGVSELFETALAQAKSGKKGRHIRGNRDVEIVIAGLIRQLRKNVGEDLTLSRHLLATKLLENDAYFESMIQTRYPQVLPRVEECRRQLAKSHGKSSDEVINAERHALCLSIFEKVSEIKKPRQHWRDRLDDHLMHGVWGYVILILTLFFFFHLIFKIGSWAEAPVTAFFDGLSAQLAAALGESLWSVMAVNALQGIGGGIAIVLPYLFPFLLGLSILEDVGYLPRIAFLMDGFMHRIGLHGKAIIPAILGYGCNVPAVMATRILESPRDRFIAAVVASMVPCAARMTIIFGLVGVYLGGTAALGLYLFNFFMIALAGGILSRIMPEVSPGMLLEMPVYQAPRLKVTLLKTWMRMKDFITIAWPLLIAGSVLLGLIDHFHITGVINALLSPVTVILGLPVEVGTTLIFGVLRKELSMLMLFQALGSQELLTVLSLGQILVFTVFVVFYIPCVATMGALYRQIRIKGMATVVLITFILALFMGLLARGVAALFL